MERAYKAKILRVVDRDTVEAEHLENRKHLLEKKGLHSPQNVL